MAVLTIAGCFKGKSILITGATGFLGKMVVEKLLRVQPDVKKLYLLVRAPNVELAKKRVLTEVVGKDLFNVLREQHGPNFSSFIEEKISPLAGDVMYENFGCVGSEIEGLAKEIEIIINGAATTNFYERYDVALASNAFSVSFLLQFAKHCPNLKMFLHVSTAYVVGEQEGLLLEKPFKMNETLKEGSCLDIDAEIQLVENFKSDLKKHSSHTSPEFEKRALKELGIKRARHFGWPNTYVFTKAMGETLLGHLRGELPVVIIRPSMITSTIKDPMPGWIEGMRTIDVLIIGSADQTIPCFIGDSRTVLDVIPGDMVINAMMVAMVAHWNEQSLVIYHVSSALENPLTSYTLFETVYCCCSTNPNVMKEMGTKKKGRLFLIHRYIYFIVYMFLVYKLPLEMLRMVNLLFCGLFSRLYNISNRNYNRLMDLAKLYAPYAFFKGCFDLTNMIRLRITAGNDYHDAQMFGFDPKCINWDSYLFNVHIPALVKMARQKKPANSYAIPE